MLKTKIIIRNFFIFLGLSLSLLSVFLFFSLEPKKLTIYFFDVGQGDAILIRTPNHFNILIDGGPDKIVLYKLGKYLPFYDRCLDLVVLTHADADHLIGLVEVLDRYQIKNILLTEAYNNSPPYRELLELIKRYNIPVLLAGEIKTIGIENNLDLNILYPFSSVAGKDSKIENEASIILRLDYNHFSALFTGDAPSSVENSLIKQNTNLVASVLKIAHHGSKASSASSFLRAVNPKLAIIPVGQNRFGHPNPEVLARLEQLNIKFLDTKNKGDIIISSRGQNFWLNQSPINYLSIN
jgi:competence protein ComEC